jgi:hypothetical protein
LIPFPGILTFNVRQIFDPIRVLMVEGKILDWFDYRGDFLNFDMSILDLVLYVESRLYRWFRRNTVDRLTIKPLDAADVAAEAASHEAEVALHGYLHDIPSECLLYFFSFHSTTSTANIAFLYGPQGSGKSRTLSRLLQDKKRYIPVLLPYFKLRW